MLNFGQCFLLGLQMAKDMRSSHRENYVNRYSVADNIK